MKGKTFPDPYTEVLHHLNRKGVRYVVVGMSGINYYARNARETFTTMDYDIFLEPLQTNVRKAVGVLKELGWNLAVGGKAFEAGALKDAVWARQTLVATTPQGPMIELLLEVSGFPFLEMAKDAVTFNVGETPIPVGKLDKLLLSKRLANRPKDRHFLKRFQALLEE